MTEVLARLREALAERYTIEREIGRGGMATVYLARDTKHNRAVALKVLHPELATAIGSERFLREIRTTAQLTHPHILPMHDSGNASGLLYYTMPFIDGESLRERLRREKRLTVDEALDIALQIADALAYAHAHRVVHRDIKPENVLFSGGRHIWVSDFGLARALQTAGNKDLTASGFAVGSPRYMSPEQAVGDEHIDGRSDIYSLACVIYEMLAGAPPFDGQSPQAVIARHIVEPPPMLAEARPDVPAHISKAVTKAMAKDPRSRFASAANFMKALEPTASTIAYPRPFARSMRLRRIPRSAWAGAGVVFILAVGIADRRGYFPSRLLASRRDASPTGTTTEPRIAVLPFAVESSDSAVRRLGVGMVDFLSPLFSGEVGPPSVHPTAVLRAWGRKGGRRLTATESQDLARDLGASEVVTGSVVALGRSITVNAAIDRVTGASRPLRVSVSAPAESLPTLVERVATQLLAARAGETPDRIPNLTTSSSYALSAYLSGRIALRAGRYDEARANFSRALDADTTFALAALGLTEAGGWALSSGAERERTGMIARTIRLRRLLSPRDRALFDALVGTPGTVRLAARELADWERAVTLLPDAPIAWYEYGDRFFHVGSLLGIPGSWNRAAAAFRRAIELDSGFTQPYAHLVQTSLAKGDVRGAKGYLQRVLAAEGENPELEFVRWRYSVAVPSAQTIPDFAALSTGALERISGVTQLDGLSIEYAEKSITELRQRATTPDEELWALVAEHALAMNRGEPARVARVLGQMRALEPIRTGVVTSFFTVDQLTVLGTLFGGSVPGQAMVAVTALTKRVGAAPPNNPRLRAVWTADLCTLGFWLAEHSQLDDATAVLRDLRRETGTVDAIRFFGADSHLCATLLDATIAVSRSRADAAVRLAAADSAMAEGPVYVFAGDFGNLVVARLYQRLGQPASALRVIRRRSYYWTPPGTFYLAEKLRLQKAVAEAVGDRAAVEEADRLLRAFSASTH